MKLRFMHIIFAFVLLSTSSVYAKSADWTLYDALLKDHVNSGVRHGTPLMTVDYLALQRDPRFAKVVAQLAQYDVLQLTNKEEKLAFYINAYNILAIKMVLDHWPVDSIKDIGSFFFPVWKKNVGKIGGKLVSLDEVEHEILRPLGDSRIHMAIVCASVSCPDLRNEAYRVGKLNTQLDAQSIKFLNNPIKGLILVGNEAKVSKIFDWFEKDFAVDGGVISFLRKYRPEIAKNMTIKANLDYDWSLNQP